MSTLSIQWAFVALVLLVAVFGLPFVAMVLFVAATVQVSFVADMALELVLLVADMELEHLVADMELALFDAGMELKLFVADMALALEFLVAAMELELLEEATALVLSVADMVDDWEASVRTTVDRLRAASVLELLAVLAVSAVPAVLAVSAVQAVLAVSARVMAQATADLLLEDTVKFHLGPCSLLTSATHPASTTKCSTLHSVAISMALVTLATLRMHFYKTKPIT